MKDVPIISIKKHHKTSPESKENHAENKEEYFDPYNYGQEDGISCGGAAILIIKGCIGCSFLLMPYVMKKLGYVTGTITVISTGIVYYHTVHSLLSTEYQLCKELKLKKLSYVEVAEKTLQRSSLPFNKLHTFVKYLIYFFYSLPTSNAAYLVLLADGIQSIMRRFNVHIKTTYIISLEFIPLTLVCLVPKILDILVPYSSITNILTFFMASATITSSVIQRKESVALQPFGDLYSIPECIAKCVKAYCCTGIIIPIKNDMKKPQQLVSKFGAMNVAAATVITSYYIFGAILYVNYGDEVQENILFNLPPDNYLSDTVKFLYTSSLLVSYILAFFSRHNNVWAGSFKEAFAGKKYELMIEYGIRLGINLLAYLLAVAVPNLALISALAGTASFIVEVALPSILELLSVLEARKKKVWIICKNFIIICISFLLFFMSLTSCIKQVIALYFS